MSQGKLLLTSKAAHGIMILRRKNDDEKRFSCDSGHDVYQPGFQPISAGKQAD